ncbi:DUF2194 domain-containing protein [Paenibacillus sp. Soil724D2]|uniref:DUF2194 domain-containing protein n=1 Tax=Paenibacillus sp. (strain Soil724D2) TaxID=1736392 RepID=UPI000713FE9D|nr:DUF2194 domain-containing protein [Paenibacillus sp. Soil724D2]KRE40961.1 hypothetical protein ASG85_34360 [Paenibacillus sp. Soil724D2]
MKTFDYFKRTTIIVVLVIVVLGISLETVRSDFLFKLTKNNNITSTADTSSYNALDPKEFNAINTENFLILYDQEEIVSPRLAKNVENTINYMKKKPQSMEIGAFDGTTKGFETIIIALQDLTKIKKLDALITYVDNGGRVLFAESPLVSDSLYTIYRKLGINSIGPYVNEKGIKLTSNILIQGKGMEFKGDFIENAMIFFELNNNSTIYAVTDKNNPLMWGYTYGKGKFLVFNGSTLQEKTSRGLIAGALSLINDNFIYPIINTKVAYIDDFPAPFGNGKENTIYKEYGRDNQRFYRDIWWPDMIKIAKNRGVIYTGVLIENYNNSIKPPFNTAQGQEKENLIIYGREVLKLGGELGLHGYNHQSLVTDYSKSTATSLSLGYKLWQSQEDMELSISEARKYFADIYPKYKLRTYVPPSNVLSDEGREALKNSLPDLKIIASIYSEDPYDKSYVQEYSRSADGILELPRVSSGYHFDQVTNWDIFNAITSIGVFSHFIHPDDVLDPARTKNKSWDQLFKEFDQIMEIIYDKYKWLRPMTASDAGTAFEDYLDSQVVFKKDKNKIDGYVNNFHGELNYILRTTSKIGRLDHCSITLIDNNTYIVQAKAAHFTIELGDQS